MTDTGFSADTYAQIQHRACWWCERCGLRRGEQAHHRRPRGMGGSKSEQTNLVSNGLWLCQGCHCYVETNRSEAIDSGWLVEWHKDPADVPVIVRGQWRTLTNDGLYDDAICNRPAMGGGHCELLKGHIGKHARVMRNYARDIKSVPWGEPTGVFEWSDASQARLADRYGSRFD